MWKGWSRKKYGFEIRRDMWKGGKINWWNWADQRIDAPKNCFFPQVGEHWGNIGPELWWKHKWIWTQGGRLSLYSAYSRENHSEIFHNSVFTLVESKTPPKRHIATSETKINFQGLQMKFPADNDMLKGCYGNRTSCLNKDLPSEVWVKTLKRGNPEDTFLEF